MSERNEALPRPLIIGESDQIKKVIAAVERFAAVSARVPPPVMIYGESGTGKELFARLLHASSWTDGPFIAVNAGAIPESLVESELFGYVGGAFTGALREGKAGLWEAAEGGTLFLDEIGDLPLAAQVKVLRVLEQRAVRRAGGIEDIPVDVRIVAATNVNLLEGVQAGKFRRDLYYRLHVLHITVPPLRDRQGDILLILDYMMRTLCTEWGLGEPPTISRDARDKLLGYGWPGNIREMESVLMRTLSLLRAGVMELQADDFELSESEVKTPLDMIPMLIKKGSLPHMKTRAEYALIQWALNTSEGNQSVAAKFLGIHRNTLITKLHKYRLLKDE